MKNPGAFTSDVITTFVGSWVCVGLHSAWFALWFVFHLDINLLTLIVSLEAIYLCTIIMMSQNRQAEKDRQGAQSDYQTDITAERKIEEMMLHLDRQDHMILKILRHLEIGLEA